MSHLVKYKTAADKEIEAKVVEKSADVDCAEMCDIYVVWEMQQGNSAHRLFQRSKKLQVMHALYVNKPTSTVTLK